MHAIPDTHCIGSDWRQPSGAGDLWELGLTAALESPVRAMLTWLASDAGKWACTKGVLTCMGVSWKDFRVADIAGCLILCRKDILWIAGECWSVEETEAPA